LGIKKKKTSSWLSVPYLKTQAPVMAVQLVGRVQHDTPTTRVIALM